MSNLNQERPNFEDIQNPKPIDLLYYFALQIQNLSHANIESNLSFSKINSAKDSLIKLLGITIGVDLILWNWLPQQSVIKYVAIGVCAIIVGKKAIGHFNTIKKEELNLRTINAQLRFLRDEEKDILTSLVELEGQNE